MAKPISELTRAIRQLCDETGGNITHAQARPRLAEMGFEIAEEPVEKTEDLKAFETACKGYELADPNDPEQVKQLYESVRAELGWNKAKLAAVLKEFEVRKAFHAERNNYDVIKYNWRKAAGPSTSTKPANTGTGKAAVAAKHGRTATPDVVRPKAKGSGPRPKHPAAPAAADAYAEALEALRTVKSQGGIAAVQKKLEGLKTKKADLLAQAETIGEQADQLEAMLEQVATLERELHSAA